MIRLKRVSKFFSIQSFIFLAFTQNSFSKNHSLIISGFNDDKDDREVCKSLYSAEVAKGHEVFVAAGLGEWTFGEKKQMLPARSINDIKSAVQKAVNGLQAGESLFIYIDDHGIAPTDKNDPLTAGIALRKNLDDQDNIVYKDFAAILQKNIPPGTEIKILGTLCFAGGIHAISHILTHVCSAAVTDYRNPSFTSTYLSALLPSAPSGSAPSLYEVHLAGAFSDRYNNLQTLSSMDYLDKYLKNGKYSNIPTPDYYRLSVTELVKLDQNSPFKICDISNPSLNFNEISNQIDLMLKSMNNLLRVEAINQDLESKNLLAQVLDLNKSFMNKIINTSPMKNSQNHKLLQQEIDNFSKLKSEWNAFGSFRKLINRSSYTERVKISLGIISFYSHDYIQVLRAKQNLEKQATFLMQATEVEKKKYFDLLRCELAPM
jgi:hypothetical protein